MRRVECSCVGIEKDVTAVGVMETLNPWLKFYQDDPRKVVQKMHSLAIRGVLHRQT